MQVRFPDFAAGLLAGDRVDWPGGEAVDAVERRVRAAWERLATAAASTVAVTHGGIVAGMLTELDLTAPSPLGPGTRARWISPAAAILLRPERVDGRVRWLAEGA